MSQPLPISDVLLSCCSTCSFAMSKACRRGSCQCKLVVNTLQLSIEKQRSSRVVEWLGGPLLQHARTHPHAAATTAAAAVERAFHTARLPSRLPSGYEAPQSQARDSHAHLHARASSNFATSTTTTDVWLVERLVSRSLQSLATRLLMPQNITTTFLAVLNIDRRR